MTTRKHERDEAAAYLEPPVDGETETTRDVEGLTNRVASWRFVEDGSELKECPACSTLALEGETDCTACGLEPGDDETWREIRRLRSEVERAEYAERNNVWKRRADRAEAELERRDAALRAKAAEWEAIAEEEEAASAGFGDENSTVAAIYAECAEQLRATTEPEEAGE